MNNIKPWSVFLCLGILMSILFSSGQIENPDTHLRLTQTRIINEDGKFGLPNDVGEDHHGNIAITDSGQRHMVYNPGQSLLFLPIYFVADNIQENEADSYYTATFLVSFINYLIHALCALFLFKITSSIGFSSRKSYFVAFVFLLTSYSFSFAQSTYEHHFEMLFILLGYYFIISKSNVYYASMAGLAIAIGIIFRSTSVLAIPGILLLIENTKTRLYFLSFLAPGVIAILVYNFYRFGNPLETGYNLAWMLANGQNIEFWTVKRIPLSLIGFLFSPAKGLLFFSPTIILALIGISRLWKRHRRLTLSILTLCGFYFLTFSMNFAWHGSIWSFGPRYILPVLPFLYIPLVEVEIKKWMFPVLIFSFLGQILFTTVNYKKEVLEQYVKFDQINEEQYIFSFNNNPYTIQFSQLLQIIPKNISGELKNYFPDTPWKKEVRTSSSKEILEFSIEKNSINYWWVRIFHWEKPLYQKGITIFILFGAIVTIFILSKHVKRICE